MILVDFLACILIEITHILFEKALAGEKIEKFGGRELINVGKN